MEIGKKYRQTVLIQPMIELALGPLLHPRPSLYALANGIYGTVPFLVLFQIGFLYTGLLPSSSSTPAMAWCWNPATEEEL